MSGPVAAVDAPPAEPDTGHAAPPCVEVTSSRNAEVGGVPIRRGLPQRGRRTVGPWCFEDHMGPTQVTETAGLDIGPHPHIGLHTVTWLLSGEVLHRDSLGTEQLIRPGQLNLMTAGRGVAHSEEAATGYRGELHGVQLWVAQPDRTRDGDPAFEHHGELPQVELGSSVATVVAGDFAGAASAARADTPLVAVDGELRAGEATWPLRPNFEYGVVVLDGAVSVHDQVVRPGQFAYLGEGRAEIPLSAREPTRVLLIGGTPFEEPIVMWWNYVARTRDEITTAHAEWEKQDPRFGPVASPLPRMSAPGIPWGPRP